MKRFIKGPVIALVFALLLNANSPSISSANIFSNKVDANPIISKNVEILLIDLSRSVDKDVVIEGLESVRRKISNVYESSQEKYDAAAVSYYFWLPILGQNDRKDFSTLFDSKNDRNMWSVVRSTVGGRVNQVNTLEKLRTEGGLWRELILAGNIQNCLKFTASTLKTPGLFGDDLANLSKGVCEQAMTSRNNIYKLNKTVSDYLSDTLSNNGGSDIMGAIDRLDDEMFSGLKEYKKVNLIFVSDGVNNTPNYALRKILSKQGADACNLGRMAVKEKNNYSSSKVSVNMYGIGEGRPGKNGGKGNDTLRPALKEYWTCFWDTKGSIKPKFGQLNELGMG